MEPYFDMSILRQLTLKTNMYCLCVQSVDLSLFPFPIEPMCVFVKPLLERHLKYQYNCHFSGSLLQLLQQYHI